MKKLLVALLALGTATALTGCVFWWPFRLISSTVGSSRLVDREFNFDDFDRVELGQAAQFEITQSPSYRVRVSINENYVDGLEVVHEGRTLRVGVQPGRYSYNNLRLLVKIDMPSLSAIEASGAASGTISGFTQREPLQATVSGASRLSGDIQAGDVRFEVSGASQLTLQGAGRDAKVNVSGASKALLGEFTLRDVEVVASGASRAVVDLSGQLNADVTGASSLEYSGTPTMERISTSGAGSVRRR